MLNVYVRWENIKKKRYYSITLEVDLFGELILTKAWGSMETDIGNILNKLFSSEVEALDSIKLTHNQRIKRGYSIVKQKGIVLRV